MIICSIEDYSMIISLKAVIYDSRARDGTWCKLPYPDHPKGYPKFPECLRDYPDFKDYEHEAYNWFAIIEKLNLRAHAKRMKDKHPSWSERQCRCLLY
jgi:hypothetical protein